MSYEQERQMAVQIAEGLDAVAEVLGGPIGLPAEATKLRVRARHIREARFKVLVVGEFKRGKSTLLNALLGERVLPEKAAPCSSIVTTIRYGGRPEARIFFVDGRPEEVLEPKEFRKKYQLTLEDFEGNDRGNCDRFSHVDHAEIRYPLELCLQGVELVDSPGLGEHRVRSARTEKYLDQADAVVMVLDAIQLLNMEEQHFLDNVLKPRNLHNGFFVINRWNVVQQSLARLDPDEREEQVAELQARVKMMLSPFCLVDGQDRSADRIFRVNALGAFDARSARPVDAALLAASDVPAFEQSLQRFLVDERGRVRRDVVGGAIQDVSLKVERYLAEQLAAADKSIKEIEAERDAIQPKLDRLRGIKQHIEGYLDSTASNLQDRLVISFQQHIRKVAEGLAVEVAQFDLKKITSRWLVVEAVKDLFREEDDKFAKQVERQVKPQVQKLLERKFAAWQQAVVRNEMAAVTIDVEKHLQTEAAEYQRVMNEIEQTIGIRTSPLQAEELVRRWLGSDAQADGSPFELAVGGVFGDMGWLVGSIAVDLVAEVFLHMAFVWIPIAGLIVTGVRMLMREEQLQSQLRERIVQAVRDGLLDSGQSEAAAMRNKIKLGFDGLKQKIVGNIDSEIALIDSGLAAILDRKHQQEFSAEAERNRLAMACAELGGAVNRVHDALQATKTVARAG